jgi:aryl sulfotransferase
MTILLRAPTRRVSTATIDSTRWTSFAPRPGDIVIATYPKSGTTWTQRIVDLLIFQDATPRAFGKASIWLDSRFAAPVGEALAALEAQTHRRFIKSHLPFDALPIYDEVKYIHVARDGRDAFLSLHNHLRGMTPAMKAGIAAAAAAEPGAARLPRPETPEDPRMFFQQWIAAEEGDCEAEPAGDVSYFDFEASFWRERRRENLLLAHYADLKADLAGEMSRISAFLEIDTPEDRLQSFADAARFDTMRAQADLLMPGLDAFFDRGVRRFLHKGANGLWRNVLSAEDVARYEAAAERKLTPVCRVWLEQGRAGGDPSSFGD